jgi:phage terminase large subunit-like protein
LIEDKTSGTQLIQELIAEGLFAVTRHQPQSERIMRMHAQTAMIENGFVHLPRGRNYSSHETGLIRFSYTMPVARSTSRVGDITGISQS